MSAREDRAGLTGKTMARRYHHVTLILVYVLCISTPDTRHRAVGPQYFDDSLRRDYAMHCMTVLQQVQREQLG